MFEVLFTYHAGTTEDLFHNPRLTGSWTEDGRYSDSWLVLPMEPFRDDAGCRAYRAAMQFAPEEAGRIFFWGVIVDAPGRVDLWAVTTEAGPFETPELHRAFTLGAENSVQTYRLTSCRHLGANKVYREGSGAPGIRFSVWAPHARQVATVIASSDSGGYIDNGGKGVAETLAMTRDGSGVWSTDPADPALTDYSRLAGARYMFKITREDGSVAYRTDIYSRCQAGKGTANPEKDAWSGKSEDLESTKSCSVVKDPDTVAPDSAVEDDAPRDAALFWQGEFSQLHPLPSTLEDLIIYEMHIAGLGAGHEGAGTLRDAMGMLDYLADLGVNAVELLPVSEFEGGAGWGYGSSHFHAIKYDPEGRDCFKRFVRACHQRGMAVIVDVVYNHYSPDSERVHWMYDTTRHDHNMYYYYHGKQEEYPGDMPEGGYCDNYSTGYLPGVGEEMVRGMLIGSAAALLLEYHVDGFRMDLTQALHSFNVLHKDGSPVPEANESGIRFMREWARTLRILKPGVFLLAEDHSGWSMMSRVSKLGGVGFDAAWWSEWYHQLIGDADQDNAKAHLLRNAGYGTARPLKMNVMAGMLLGSPGRVVYHESHDESGNSERSARNIEVAVNGMLFDNTRAWGEARCRVVAGITMFSAGIPMFFMGEEVCAREPYRHGDFLEHREDFKALRESTGKGMFRFYQDIVRLRREHAGLRSSSIAVLKVHNQQRILAWHRWRGDQEFVIIASLSNTPFEHGYAFTHRNLKGKIWKEILNSEAPIYGGPGGGNNNDVDSVEGTMNVALPACGILVFARKS